MRRLLASDLALAGASIEGEAVQVSEQASSTPSEAEVDTAFADPVFQDSSGVVHIYGTEQRDLIGVYEFGVLGITFNGALYQFDAADVTDVVMHDLGEDDIVATSEQNALLSSQEASPVLISGASAALESGPEGEEWNPSMNEPPMIHNFSCYEHSLDVWLFEGFVEDDGSVDGLTVHLDFLGGTTTSSTATDSSGNFSTGMYIDPGLMGEVAAWVIDDQGVSSDVVYCWVDNYDSSSEGS